jgi:hypothetical protein
VYHVLVGQRVLVQLQLQGLDADLVLHQLVLQHLPLAGLRITDAPQCLQVVSQRSDLPSQRLVPVGGQRQLPVGVLQLLPQHLDAALQLEHLVQLHAVVLSRDL